MKITEFHERPGHMFGVLRDLPNLITLLGFVLSILAIVAAIRQRYELAMVAALWAVVADWLDGWIAGRIKGRPRANGEMGAQLDSFADLISSGIFPAVLVATVGQYSPLAIAAAVFIATTGIVRLSFFNVYGATTDGRVLGLPIAHNILVLALITVLHGWFDPQAFAWILGTANVLLALMNVAPFYYPREGVAIIPWIVGYAAVMSGILLSVPAVMQS